MITYRKATQKDAEQIATRMTNLHKGMTAKEHKAEVEFFMKTKPFFVAFEKEKLVGYLFGDIRKEYVEGSQQFENPKVGYIESLYVLPSYRRHGIGEQLFEMLEVWAKEKGATEMGSDAYATNTVSRKFHKALGFEESKPIVHYIKKLP